MPEDRWEKTLGVGAGKRVRVGMADAGRLDLDQDFTAARTVEIDLLDLQRLSGLMRDCRFDFHRKPQANWIGGR